MFVSLGIYYYLAEQRCKGGYLLRNAICTSVFWLAVDFLLYMGDMASVFVYSIFILGQGEGPRWIKEMEHSLYGPTYMFFFLFFFLLNQGVQALGPNPPRPGASLCLYHYGPGHSFPSETRTRDL